MMMTDSQAFLLVLSGLIGLSCWFVGMADNLYRLRFQRTARQRFYDRVDNVFITIGSLFVAGFAGGLYYFVIL